MKEVLLGTKLHMPPCRQGMISRPRLKSRLDTGLHSRMILVSAPAGFGKTSLLSEWLADYGGLTAWISLDKADNDPARFLRYLVAAIQKMSAGVGETAENLLSSPQPGLTLIEPLLIVLLNELERLSEKVTIVFDDYHFIDNITLHNAISFLIDNAPSQVHVIISTRSDPPLPLPRWRARGEMIEIRAEDLRFLPDETAAYLTGLLGQVLSVDDIAMLEEKTEGWAAGLQMAVLSMQGRKDLSDFIHTFSGGHRYIMDYLVEEVLQRQPADIQSFLLQTSVLERLNGSLCDAVTGQTGSQQRLEILESNNMFLLPLDDSRRWYRYHHLFSDLLRARLQASQPDIIDTLHLRAAQWYADKGMITGAITHYMTARDYQRMADLVEQVALSLIIRGEMDTLLKWNEQLPDEIIFSRPRLCVHLAWLYIFAGRLSDASLLLENAESSVDRNKPSDEERDILGSIATQRAFMADLNGDTALAIDLVKKAGGLLATTNLTMRSSLPFILARAYRLDGELEKSIVQLNEVARIAREAGNIMTLAVANYEMATIWKIEGKLHKAEAIYREMINVATEKNVRHFGTIAKIDAGMCEILRERNELDIAASRIEDAIERMKSWGNPTDLVIAYIMQARILQAQGDLDAAVIILEKAEQIRLVSPVFPPLGIMIETDRVKLWLAQGRLSQALRWMEELQSDEVKPLIIRELEQITMARVLLARGKTSGSITLLEELQEAAEAGGRKGKLIEILLLQSLAFKALNDENKALTALGRALYLAEPEGYLRIFADEGTPMAELMFAFKQRKLPEMGNYPVGKEYLSELLGVLSVSRQAGKTGLPENLSDREMEVLRMMAKGMTNKQIALELFITAGTVKAHTANIYRKLEVTNRTQSIALARELKLL